MDTHTTPATSVDDNENHDDFEIDGGAPVQVGAKRKSKRRSSVWDNYTEFIPDLNNPNIKRVRCNFCLNKTYKSDTATTGTSTMRKHIENCPKNPKNNSSNTIDNNCIATGVEQGGVDKYDMGSKIKFDQEAVRKVVVEMLIIDELPFRFVENEGFLKMMKVACPLFQMPSRFTVARDCIKLYKKEKAELKAFFKKTKQRISITTDGWTSNQNMSYLVLTAHFIDDEWKLRKRIINFITCPSHKGEEVGLLIEECLKEWGIDYVFTITVDNAAANDKTVDYLRRKFNAKGNAVLGGKYMHVRCVAHIINLIVKNGLADHNISIDRVRNAVKYILHSPARELKFKDCADKENIGTNKFLTLDCVTRWNSVFLMLDRAILYKSVFERYRVEETSVRVDFANEITCPKAYPTDFDWEIVSFMSKLLENFHGATVRVSGVSYVTSNMFLDEVGSICSYLNEWVESDNSMLKNFAEKMKDRFDKYWGSISEKANVIFHVATLLDPRHKLYMLKEILKEMYGEEIGNDLTNNAVIVLKEFYEEYHKIHPLVPIYSSSTITTNSSSSITSSLITRPPTKYMKPKNSIINRIKEKSGTSELQSEIDKYLNADRVETEDFSILDWWKDHKNDYPVLSKLARDVFSIPISTVASESAFSTSGRVIDDFRSSLNPKTAEALICTQDWIRAGHILSEEEEFELLQEVDKDLRRIEGDVQSVA